MKVLSGVNRQAWLVGLVCDTEPDTSSKHHHRALHVIVHHVLQFRLKGLLINNEEVNLFISNNLNPYVAPNEIDLPSHVIKSFVLCPEASFDIDLEEQDRVG
jgi:hypothetical protein